jgi:hypothetical protein
MKAFYTLIMAALIIFCAFNMVDAQDRRDETCEQIDSVWVTNKTQASVMAIWLPNDTALAYNVRYREVEHPEWTYKSTLDTFFIIEDLEDCEDHELGVRAVCPFDTAMYTLDTFIAYCPGAVFEGNSPTTRLQVSPNPCQDLLRIEWQLTKAENIGISVFDIHGRIVQRVVQDRISEGTHELSVPTWNLDSGIYFVILDNGTDRVLRKVLKL